MNVIVYNIGCARENTMAGYLVNDLKGKGHNLVRNVNEADTIIYISCASDGHAFKRCFKEIDAFMRLKNPEAKFILAGCLTNVYAFEEYLNRNDFKLITDRNFVVPIENYLFEEQKRNSVQKKLKYSTRLVCNNNISIQFMMEEGCINNCSFCKYNYMTKGVQSLPYNIALEYLKGLIRNGTKCITLSGDNLTLYGIDLTGKPMLHQFVHDLSLIDGLEQINLYEVCPQNMYPELLQEIIRNPKIKCVYMQLEMAPNHLLGLMNRNHSIEKYLYYVKKIQESGKFVLTVLMCSFPTETYEDLDFTIDVIQKNKIVVAQVYRYSDFAYIPSHNLEQLSPNESRRHVAYLKRKLAIANQMTMWDAIPLIDNSIVVGKSDKKVFFENFASGYSFKKEYQDCELGDIITDKPRALVRDKRFNYMYDYKW